MAKYEQTVPGQMCRFWYDACTNATFGANGEGNRAEQFKCDQARDNNCGQLKFNNSEDASATASSSASGTGASQTSGSATGSGAAATGSNTATPSSGAIAQLALGTPILAGGLLAVFGLAL